MSLDTTAKRTLLIRLSPLIIIAVGHLTARIAVLFLDVWAWIPVVIVLWILFAGFVTWGDGWKSLGKWLQPSQGKRRWIWILLALIVAFLPFQLMLANLQLFNAAWLVVVWLLFAVINAPLEEFYWRGLLLDHMRDWPRWTSILFTSFFFTINHPLTLGVFSIANRHPATLISIFILGVVWAVVYLRTNSLRWVIASHFLIDIFNLSILTFLNIYVPPPLPIG